jgi:hypothetical protein
MLRYADPNEATVWVETSVACEVEVLDQRTSTFCVSGHHYAILILEGLEPGSEYPYGVALDGKRVWPEGDAPQGLIRTPDKENDLILAFGSCRVSLPHEPPYTCAKDEDDRGREVDSLAALAIRMKETPEDEWPDAMMLVGDQVYADEVSPDVAAKIKARRSTDTGSGEEIADFEEYSWLYQESWSDPAIRWLLSSLPSAMIFDDHDVTDDWNTSGTWIRQQRKKDWWRERLLGAYISYWIYQHLGNLSPTELRENELLRKVRDVDGDAESLLREFAGQAADETETTRWSYHRDFGRTRLVVLDTRAGRLVEDDADRRMLSREEWEWATNHITGDFEHLLIASSLPVLMSPGIHHLQAWNEALCAGAWGKWGVGPSEKLRRALDLEHWPAFQQSFRDLLGHLRAVGAGEYGKAPASIILLSGDVHHAYVAAARFPDGSGVTSRLVQAVCSPMRNPLDSNERHMMKAALSRPGGAFARLLSRSAGVPNPPLRWRFIEDPTFDNQVGTVETKGSRSRIRIERTDPEDWRRPTFKLSLDYDITR